MIFDWSNFDLLSKDIGGPDAEPEWLIESAHGRALNYAFDSTALFGRMEYFEFERPLRTIVLDCGWREDRDLHIRDGDWIRFNFSLSIDIAMELTHGRIVNATGPSWRVINNPPEAAVVEHISADSKTVWVTVCCLPELITAISGRSLEDMPDLLRMALSPASPDSFHEDFDFTARLGAIASDIIRTNLGGALRVSYVEARSMELLCLAIDEIMHPRAGPPPIRLSANDEKSLREARNFLTENFVEPPTIQQLGREFGINRNKLYYGFRALFSCTISEFIQERRLEEGRRLLETTELAISEIARTVGFAHQCNFSTAFRKRFGLAPSQIRNRAYMSSK